MKFRGKDINGTTRLAVGQTIRKNIGVLLLNISKAVNREEERQRQFVLDQFKPFDHA